MFVHWQQDWQKGERRQWIMLAQRRRDSMAVFGGHVSTRLIVMVGALYVFARMVPHWLGV